MTNFNLIPLWEVVLHNQSGKPVALFDSAERFVINKKLNDIGTFAIEFIDDGDDRLSNTDYWQLDGVVKFERDLPYFVGEVGETYTRAIELEGLYRKRTASISSGGEKTINFEGVSLEHLLSRRIIAALEGTIRSDKNDHADTVICEYVDENCGPNATPARGRYFFADYGDATSRIDAYGVMPGFGVQVPAGISPAWAGSKSMENLLDAVKDIGRAKLVDFNIIRAGEGQFTFAVWPDSGLGKNRTFTEVNPTSGLNKFGNKPVVFSIANDNVESITLNYDRLGEVNFVFVLGQGDMSTRSVYPAENAIDSGASPWNQMEASVSASSSDFVYQLKDAANEVLSEGAYLESIDFVPFQTPSCFYGYHYFIGDFVTVQFDYARSDYRIIGVTIDYSSDGEKITLQMESPTRQVEGVTPNAS